jgi:hypothetical protein
VNRDLHPTDGARYLLERDDELEGGARARYRVAIYTPDAEFAATATLGDDGSADVAPTGAPDDSSRSRGYSHATQPGCAPTACRPGHSACFAGAADAPAPARPSLAPLARQHQR